jgi:carbamoyl-phosphate synthase large subunit
VSFAAGARIKGSVRGAIGLVSPSTEPRYAHGREKTRNVLVFPGGTEIGLEIHRALSQCKEARLFSAGSDVSSHAPYIFARHFVVPNVNSPAWVEALNRLIAEQNIDYIFPAHDDVLVALAQNAECVNAKIVSSPLNTCLITRSKSETYNWLTGTIPVPQLYSDFTSVPEFPIFVKPDRGQGSQGTQIVGDRQQLSRLLGDRRDYIAIEYLPGEEYTVDCFSDRDAGLLFCGGRQRIRTRNGISAHSVTVQDPLFQEYAHAISSKLAFHGAWFFQLKRSRADILTLLEVAPRIAGTTALHRVLGVNLPLLSLYEQERVPIQIMTNNLVVDIDRALVNRYSHNVRFSSVYVDLDDTLILNGKVNTQLVRFLYQCLNAGKRLVLVSKHADDIGGTLRRHRLTGLFDEIIHCDHAACKADFIVETDAILIDDSFSERRAVRAARDILTFDCSMLEMLIEERA